MIAGCVIIAGIAVARLVRRTKLYTFSLVVALLDLVTQILLVVLGFAFLFSPHALGSGLISGRSRRGTSLRSPCRSPSSPTPASRPSRTSRRRRASRAATCRAVSSRRSAPSCSSPSSSGSSGFPAFPATGRDDRARDDVAARAAHGDRLRARPAPRRRVEHILRVYVGLTGALILLTAAITSNSGFGRLAYSLGEHGQLPRAFARLSRRSMHSPAAGPRGGRDLDGAPARDVVLDDDAVAFLASLFSFGVLVAFIAAQLAVMKLRFSSRTSSARTAFRSACGSRAATSRFRPSSGSSRRPRSSSRLWRRTSAPATPGRRGCSSARSSISSSAAAAAPASSSTSRRSTSASYRPRRRSRRSSCR